MKPVKKNVIQKNHTIILSIVIGVLCFLSFSYYFKNKNAITNYKNEIINLEKKQKIVALTRKENKKIKQSIKKLQIQLKELPEHLIYQDTCYSKQQLSLITHYAHTIGLCINSCIVEKLKNKKWFNKQNVIYDLTGTLAQINQFIKKIQSKKQSLKCKNFDFNQTEKNKSNLKCTLQLISFKEKKPSNFEKS
ncbi:hypothetical protein KAH94_02310 [bacterium]|nr:hypothetical protein [bacterium]